MLPGDYDETTDEITVSMPSLVDVVRERVEELRAALPPPPPPPEDAEEPPEEPVAAVDPDGGLNGLAVVVELTINGQQYTKDALEFVYYGHLEFKEPTGAEGEELAEAQAGGSSVLVPVANIPAAITDQSLFVKLTVTYGDEAVEELKIKGTLRFTAADEAIAEVILPTVVREGAPVGDATLALTLNDQHWHAVPGAVKIQTVAPDPPAD